VRPHTVDVSGPPAENKRMKQLLIALAIIATTLAAAEPAQARARIEQLRAERGGPGRTCTIDRIWCLAHTGDALTIVHRENRNTRDVARLPLPSDEDDRVESAPWTSIVRVMLPGQPEFVLVGVVRTQREMYSGGGGSLSQLALFEIRAETTGQPQPAFEAPLASSFMIRACFSREDERARRGACHDEYRYGATLIAPPQRPHEARLIYRSRADSFPGRRSRLQDSSREAPLRKADLIRAVDRTCSFERALTRNPATGAFAWSAPRPPCSDYLELQ
jgi:hypothetical protein